MAINIDDLKDKFSLSKLNGLAPFVLLVLVIYLCWKLASMFWMLVAPPQSMQLDRVEIGSQQARVPNISAFALFEEQGQMGMPTAELNDLQLQGVMVASPVQNSSAVLKYKDKSERFKVGDLLGDTGYSLAEVHWDRVVLRQGSGGLQELQFKRLEHGLNQPIQAQALNQASAFSAPASTGVTPSSNSSNEQGQTQQELGRAIDQIQENRDAYLQNMGVNTADGGYEVTSRTPAVLRSRLGLRPGDRIMSLNGQTLGQGQSEAELLEQARREGQVKLEIKRGDQVMTIQQDFK